MCGPFDRSTAPFLTYSASNRPQNTSDPKNWHLLELQQLVFFCCRNRELISIVADQTGLLETGQWTFSLHLGSDQFKEVQNNWSGVTWRVVLGSEEGKNLWQLAIERKPSMIRWRYQMAEIYKENPGFPTLWYSYCHIRIAHVNPNTMELELIEGGDGKTYLGPSV